MSVSIIIVNYNVKYFLDQCLASVFGSDLDAGLEVIVVDNHSSDDSVDHIRRKYPSCTVLVNDENLGFSRANNQGIRGSTGDYVLLLNPDTILQKDSLQTCLRFMQTNPGAGAVGVKMYDGSGKYLPESKRGFPTPFVAFCKAFGISALFPRSKVFNRYHLGHLDPDHNHEVEALSGAFMFIRREALDRAGLLDEQFFMYGEDIDLSYRILRAGYRVHYLADSAILHFKGESTRKSSLRYYRHFYNAMILFARKHFSSGRARFLQFFIRFAIYGKAAISYLGNTFGGYRAQAADLLLSVAVFLLIKSLWSSFYFGDPGYLPDTFQKINLPVYSLCMLLGFYFAGVYHRPASWWRRIRGGIYGLVSILLIYALLPTYLRSSRMVILLGAFGATFITGAIRYLYRRIKLGEVSGRERLLLAGSEEDVRNAVRLLEKVDRDMEIAGFVHHNPSPAADYLGALADIGPISRRFGVDQVIFCRDSYDMDSLIGFINRYGRELPCKIFSEQTGSVLGSSSRDSRGEIYTTDIRFRLTDPLYLQWKRLLSVLIAILLTVFFPLIFFLFSRPGRLLRNCFRVIANRITWVGYLPEDRKLGDLPPLPPSVQSHRPVKGELSGRQAHQLNFLYALEYNVWTDLQIIFQYFRSLDRQPNANATD